MKKQTIAIDIDDVLAANAKGFITFSNEQWGTNLTIDDYDEHWGLVWNIEHMDEIERRAHIYFDSGIFARYRHFPEAIPVLKALAQNYKLILVTSRRKRLLKETTNWVERHFPGMFDGIHYAGIWDVPMAERHMATKAGLCKELGANYLIDDQLKHCVAAAEIDITALLFGNYTWNQSKHLPRKVKRVKDWAAIKEFFDAAR